MHTFLTLLVGAIVVVGGLLTVTRRNPVHAVLSMLVSLCGVGVLMLGLHAPFLAAMQILLYGGAIMVLFTFVIMLLTLRDEEMGPEPPHAVKLLAAVGAFGILAVLWHAVTTRGGGSFQTPALGDAYGSIEHFARFLYTDYVVAFELITVLVTAGVAGVIVLARRPGRASLEATRLTVDHAEDAHHRSGARHGAHEVSP